MKNAVTHYTFKYFFFICKLMSFIKMTLVVVVVFYKLTILAFYALQGVPLLLSEEKRTKHIILNN